MATSFSQPAPFRSRRPLSLGHVAGRAVDREQGFAGGGLAFGRQFAGLGGLRVLADRLGAGVGVIADVHRVDLLARVDLRALLALGLEDRQRTLVEGAERSEEHTSELQSLMRISYAVFCLKKKKKRHTRIPQSP